MISYFETWNARDFDAFQATLADDMSFQGPMGTAGSAAEARKGIEGMTQIMERVEVVQMVADGEDVITWFEMHVAGKDPLAVANRARVVDGKIQRVRVTFDPRPLLGD